MKKIVWDKTNIGENYPGVTSPLTYSFIRSAYSNVYYNFLLLLGIPHKKLDERIDVFDNMLGYLDGEVFYNIDNWYELVKFLPGYKYNKEYFETMLNPVTKRKKVKSTKGLIRGIWDNKKVSFRFLFFILNFNYLNQKFLRGYRELYRNYLGELEKKDDYTRLIASFKDTSRKFFQLWSITVVNDFRTMIFFGLLSKYVKEKLSKPEEFISSLVDTNNQPRSLLPLEELKKISTQIIAKREYKRLFKKDAKRIYKSLSDMNLRPLAASINKYLDKYGDRSFNELKLEQPKLKDNPEILISLLKNYIDHDFSGTGVSKKKFQLKDDLSLLDKVIIKALMKKTTEAIYLREHFRLKRGKVFSLARKTFLELGKLLVKEDDLDKKEDVFYLYQDELFDYLQFHKLKVDLKDLVQKRKKELEEYSKYEFNRKVETHGLPNQNNFVGVKGNSRRRRVKFKGEVTSRGFLPGVEVVVLNEMDYKVDLANKVLVTKATDPGWTIVFPLLKGVITESGGMLSHASIVSRELEIPCIVKMRNVTDVLKTGDKIIMDANSGIVEVLSTNGIY